MVGEIETMEAKVEGDKGRVQQNTEVATPTFTLKNGKNF